MSTFSKADLELLRNLGVYCFDATGDCSWEQEGPIEADGQSAVGSPDYKLYRDAFLNLARLGEPDKTIDASDVAALGNREKLADALFNDPAFRRIADYDYALEYGRTEIADRIRPRDNRRLVTLAQMSLNAVFGEGTVAVNGIYDDRTKTAVAKLQSTCGIQMPDGTRMDRDTLGALAVRTKYTKDRLLVALRADRRQLGSSAILLDGGSGITARDGKPHPSETTVSHVMDALRWVGAVETFGKPDSFTFRTRAGYVIARDFRSVSQGERIDRAYVDADVLDALIRRIQQVS